MLLGTISGLGMQNRKYGIWGYGPGGMWQLVKLRRDRTPQDPGEGWKGYPALWQDWLYLQAARKEVPRMGVQRRSANSVEGGCQAGSLKGPGGEGTRGSGPSAESCGACGPSEQQRRHRSEHRG